MCTYETSKKSSASVFLANQYRTGQKADFDDERGIEELDERRTRLHRRAQIPYIGFVQSSMSSLKIEQLDQG